MGDQTLLNVVPRLILIADPGRMSGEMLLEKIAAALAGGVDAVLLRAPSLDAAHMLALAAQLRSMTTDAGARLLVHTQADIARAVAADGVHVSRHAIADIVRMRAWLGTDAEQMSFSASCHDAAELAQAREAGADFVFLSPVFATASHPGAPTLGVQGFRQLAAEAGLPVVALGGIDAGNRHTLPEFGVAVISALLSADDPCAVARILSQDVHA